MGIYKGRVTKADKGKCWGCVTLINFTALINTLTPPLPPPAPHSLVIRNIPFTVCDNDHVKLLLCETFFTQFLPPFAPMCHHHLPAAAVVSVLPPDSLTHILLLTLNLTDALVFT